MRKLAGIGSTSDRGTMVTWTGLIWSSSFVVLINHLIKSHQKPFGTI